jgi:hypothetical protein
LFGFGDLVRDPRGSSTSGKFLEILLSLMVIRLLSDLDALHHVLEPGEQEFARLGTAGSTQRRGRLYNLASDDPACPGTYPTA